MRECMDEVECVGVKEEEGIRDWTVSGVKAWGMKSDMRVIQDESAVTRVRASRHAFFFFKQKTAYEISSRD